MTTVLALTNSHDGRNSGTVLEAIQSLGHCVVRLDVDMVTRGSHTLLVDYRLREGSPRTLLRTRDSEYDLSTVDSVWFRRPYSFDFIIKDPVQKGVAERETRSVLSGLWELLGRKFWVSRPHAISRGQLKTNQIKLARGAGLLTPDTIITNDPDEARAFCGEGETVFKPVAAYSLEYEDVCKTAFTTLLSPAQVSQLHLVRRQPVLLQRYIKKSSEVRVTMIGGQCFAARLSCDDYANVVDWRVPEVNPRINYEAIELPPDIAQKIRSLIKLMELNFGAVDLAVDATGNFYFLEVNPIGQWVWVEDETGLPISMALAQLLVEGGDLR